MTELRCPKDDDEILAVACVRSDDGTEIRLVLMRDDDVFVSLGETGRDVPFGMLSLSPSPAIDPETFLRDLSQLFDVAAETYALNRAIGMPL